MEFEYAITMGEGKLLSHGKVKFGEVSNVYTRLGSFIYNTVKDGYDIIIGPADENTVTGE